MAHKSTGTPLMKESWYAAAADARGRKPTVEAQSCSLSNSLRTLSDWLSACERHIDLISCTYSAAEVQTTSTSSTCEHAEKISNTVYQPMNT
jgi:hypothetical protein